MNLVIIPYHDWRKIEMEGARTRDSHLIHHLSKNDNVENTLIINRPITYPELLVKRRLKKISGEVVFKFKRCTLYKVGEKLFVLDYISRDLFSPFIKKKEWFFKSFGDDDLYSGYLACIKYLSLDIDIILTQNIFSANFFNKIKTTSLFDAWDNFLLFPENKISEGLFRDAYKHLASSATSWITNSLKNCDFYNENYQPQSCHLVKNGVDVETFSKEYEVPSDLQKIPSPIIGFGGKITHLFDYELFNYTVAKHPDKNFVIVGQILDKDVFRKIDKVSNVFYLGDKHYSQYPAYVTNFDVGIVPYVTDNLEHGADSIKVYEYIASGLNVIGTSGAGMNDMIEYIYVASNKEEFSSQLTIALEKNRSVTLPEFYTWKFKADYIFELFTETIRLEK